MALNTPARPLSQPFDASHVATLLNLQEQGERELERALTLMVNLSLIHISEPTRPY